MKQFLLIFMLCFFSADLYPAESELDSVIIFGDDDQDEESDDIVDDDNDEQDE